MSPAAGPVSPSDVIPSAVAEPLSGTQKDKVIEWYRGEFAAANAIIDALCHHLVQLSGTGDGDEKGSIPEDYAAAFAAIHRRRLNWISVLQMQKYFTIADVSLELRKAAAKRTTKEIEVVVVEETQTAEDLKKQDDIIESNNINHSKCNDNANANGNSSEGEDSPNSEITDTGSHEVHGALDHIEICDNHEECVDRRDKIKMTKGFVAKEPVRGHMVNVVKGLKMYEDIFTASELSKLIHFVNELRIAGQNGELLGETYILFNKHIKANKREQVQLGVPLFGQIEDHTMGQEHKSNIQDIPDLLQNVIDHLVQWHILPENRKPNCCIINYLDEGEYSQPSLKPPHMDQPVCTLVLSESTMAFGRTLLNDGEGNYKGPLMLSAKEGTVFVMRNHSADMARHVICASGTRRVCITLSRIRQDSIQSQHSRAAAPATAQPMALWHPEIPNSPNGAPFDMTPKWGVIQSPVVMLTPVHPVVMRPSKIPQGGTGVFLPWVVRSRRPAKHLPPRAQKGRFLASPSAQPRISETMSDPGH